MTENERQKNTNPTPGLGRDQTLASFNQQDHELGNDDGAGTTSTEKDLKSIHKKKSTDHSINEGSSATDHK